MRDARIVTPSHAAPSPRIETESGQKTFAQDSFCPRRHPRRTTPRFERLVAEDTRDATRRTLHDNMIAGGEHRRWRSALTDEWDRSEPAILGERRRVITSIHADIHRRGGRIRFSTGRTIPVLSRPRRHRSFLD